MKFEIVNTSYYGYKFERMICYGDSDYKVIVMKLGDIYLFDNLKNNCCYFCQYALCGTFNFKLKRLIIIQMERTKEQENQLKQMLIQHRSNNFNQFKQMNLKHIEQLEEWTNLQCSEFVFDSEIDSWADYVSNFAKCIIGKSKLIFLIEDTDNELFGYYLNTKIKERFDVMYQTDSKSFHFNLQSINNRLNQPMKYEIKDTEYGGYELFNTEKESRLIRIGNINLSTKDDCLCYCEQNENLFDYHGIENALCGKTYIYKRHPLNEYFTPKRILVIQMK